MVRQLRMGNGRLRRALVVLGLFFAIIAFLAAGVYAATNIWPNLGAQAVDLGRVIFGDQAVSEVENLLLTVEDKLKQTKYKVTKSQPLAPWNPSDPVTSSNPIPLTSSGKNLPLQPKTDQAWALQNVPALGDLPGEGQWQPYLWDSQGNVVAYRTFIQPDPNRPYALVAIVAFNLDATRLPFVLGYDEPKSSVFITRPARIPAGDMVPGRILAAFNGGFKAQHGHFGVMLDGVTLIPPREGFATFGIYSNGKVVLGAWGKDITSSPQLVAYRQNGLLIVQEGQINPLTARTDPQVWGFTTDGTTATGRSALGISQDGKVLYYAAGFDLTLPVLARAVQDAGAWQAMQLDINNYYVHFEAIHFNAQGKPQAATLLDQMQGPGDRRYLTIESRDFFYVTLQQ